MKRWVLLVSAVSLSVPSVALACEAHRQSAQNQKPAVKNLTVPELAELRKDPKMLSIVDANSAETRQKEGVIPGAILLTSSSKFDVAKELPKAKDQKLVFYCANTRCTASHKAAEKAASAGFTDVSVLSDGIAGWKAAGQKTDVPRS
jgi:rhodanese-related sulfurtransferase